MKCHDFPLALASQEAVAVPRHVPAPRHYPGAPWGQGAGGFLVTA